MILEHTRRQLPIGQGFFHTGEIAVEDAVFRYVYDCGSENRGPLERSIRNYSSDVSDGNLDVLFISHLDSDHVNGLDRLLALVKTKTAVLPYLSPTARFILIAKAVEDNKLTGSYLSLLCDPTRWLTDRGVDLVIYVTPSEPPEEGPPDWTGPGPTRPFPPHLPRMADRHPSLKLLEDELRNSIFAIPQSVVRPKKGVVVSCFQPFRIGINGFMLNWQFVTFVHPEGEREADFRKAVQRTFGKQLVLEKQFTLNQGALLSILQVESQRDKLASCYMVIRKNRNLTSLSLYSGPVNLENVGIEYPQSLCPGLDESRVAWLGTGDSNLLSRPRREVFLRHYEPVKRMIHTFALPHHGSRHNYHDDLSSLGFRFVASVGVDNKYGHPHEEVTGQIDDYQLRIVTEEPKSRFVENVSLSPL